MTGVRPPAGFDPAEAMPPPLPRGPWRLSSVALDVSGTCNLACRYCAEAATQPSRRRRMPESVLDAAWRLLFPDGRPRAGTSIRLGSGEPLLNFPLLRRLGERIEERGGCAAEGRPAVFLTTNGTLAGRRVRDWLVASGWHVKVSLDGPPPVHDRWRVDRRGEGTFGRVSTTVADLARRMPERFSVTAVLCRGTDPQQVFDAAAALGVRRIELVPVAHHDPAVTPGKDDLERYQRFVRRHARRHVEEKDPGTIPTLVRFETLVRRVMGYDQGRVPCGAGRTFVGVARNGTLYPCFRFIGVEPYRLGDTGTGPEPATGERFRQGAGRSFEERAACRECWAAPLCAGPCFACAEMFGPGDGAPVALHCAYTRADARAALEMVDRLRVQDPERLLIFLPRDFQERWLGN